ncbi:MAG: hypothetical protein EPO52_06295 [Herbiconiux sp.]|uniref:hypothetical protein n=1 Tax=Herbiconiux sp. TaxID=1871186 RepID=UPI00121727A3|nr:hypothetical protein [Herbiconiux sp.]TAJ47815.1 MAG: hypothetical protein EPO52_06295 [Herbiconiux sp.]
MPTTSSEFLDSQSRYQVRLHVGVPAAEVPELAGTAHLVLVADALDDGDMAAIPPLEDATVRVVGFRTRERAAADVLEVQARRGDRAIVSIVTLAGPSRAFNVEDFLVAGAVVDALAARGIDFSSPEAAAACAAFTSLHRAVGHLVTASATGAEWAARGRTAEMVEACRIDAGADADVAAKA